MGMAFVDRVKKRERERRESKKEKGYIARDQNAFFLWDELTTKIVSHLAGR